MRVFLCCFFLTTICRYATLNTAMNIRKLFFLLGILPISSCCNINLSGVASFDGEICIVSPGVNIKNSSKNQYQYKKETRLYTIPICAGCEIDESVFFFMHNWTSLSIYLYRAEQEKYHNETITYYNLADWKDFLPYSTKNIQVKNDTLTIE